MDSGTSTRTFSTDQKPDNYDNTSGSQGTLATTTSTCTALSPEATAVNPLVTPLDWSNQPRFDSHSTVATPDFYTDDWSLLLANPLLLVLPQAWEHPGPSFEGTATGTSMIQNYVPDTYLTHTQLAHSHSHLLYIDRGSNHEPSLPYNNQTTISVSAGAPTETPQESGPIPTEVAPEVDTSHGRSLNAPFQAIRPPATSRAVPSQHRLPHHTPVPKERSYDRPGKKPAATFQPDSLKLEESCRQAGGRTFAVDWIIPTFMHGVTTEALLRFLESKEIDEMDFPGGFEPHQAFDGFILKDGDRYECGLCKESKRTWWKNKKDAPRHLRKFHFGLADVCKNCGKDVFNKAEMKTHRCVSREGRPSIGAR